jgi:hypothetical protein
MRVTDTRYIGSGGFLNGHFGYFKQDNIQSNLVGYNMRNMKQYPFQMCVFTLGTVNQLIASLWSLSALWHNDADAGGQHKPPPEFPRMNVRPHDSNYTELLENVVASNY